MFGFAADESQTLAGFRRSYNSTADGMISPGSFRINTSNGEVVPGVAPITLGAGSASTVSTRSCLVLSLIDSSFRRAPGKVPSR